MQHLEPIFVSNLTQEVISYEELTSRYDISPFTWPHYASTIVDDFTSDTNPPNEWLPTYPDINQWKRLYRPPYPDDTIKLHEIAERGEIYLDGVDGLWKQGWDVRPRVLWPRLFQTKDRY